ncbi:uncharacterized protein LOC132904106 [Amyelois transitella]|uniref:uncharacterized protein LOC132904106 n=1 Tax=Amyelois transitella TaxID=680683 RepID=UPI00298F50DB|nr:uncharacterized protein LOC132904106 [Amyelois transitella]
MSYDFSVHVPANTSTSTCGSGVLPALHQLTQQADNEVVTMDKISSLLDIKLKDSLSSFMDSFRCAIQEDVRKSVRSEVQSFAQELKNDVSSSTDFLCSEQATLKTEIVEKEKRIQGLESECARLQGDVDKLDSRLKTFKKSSRNLNIEILAVPESKNENVMMLFKQLCDVVSVTLDDSSIQACRRVAKMDRKSNRPRNILVTLTTPRLRDSLLSAVHRYNKGHPKDLLNSTHLGISGDSQRVYVTEHLSPDCKLLHAATRKFAKENEYKYVWVKYGRIYIRKDDSANSVLIKGLNTLEKL